MILMTTVNFKTPTQEALTPVPDIRIWCCNTECVSALHDECSDTYFRGSRMVCSHIAMSTHQVADALTLLLGTH